MLRAHVLHKSAVSCPVCRSAEFVTYRRLPEAEGRVVNRCTCRRCGLEFEFVEDREGAPLRDR
jgi:hypothetical protein